MSELCFLYGVGLLSSGMVRAFSSFKMQLIGHIHSQTFCLSETCRKNVSETWLSWHNCSGLFLWLSVNILLWACVYSLNFPLSWQLEQHVRWSKAKIWLSKNRYCEHQSLYFLQTCPVNGKSPSVCSPTAPPYIFYILIVAIELDHF